MKTFFRVFNGLLLFCIADCVPFVQKHLYNSNFLMWLIPIVLVYIFINTIPSPVNIKIKPFKLRICAQGSDLLFSFVLASALSVTYHIHLIMTSTDLALLTISIITALLSLALIFWNGIIRVYCTSVQLGIKHRVIGVLLGLIPIANIVALFSIISITSKEVSFECEKQELNIKRATQKICQTKYPVLLVHGVFFRDYKFPNYWGRIPRELEKNGATIYYGNHQSALSVKNSGKELAERIEKIVTETSCEKVNIIAHSKGGLDSRYAISCCGADKYVASLTTINTPHRGCLFADYLLNTVPQPAKNKIAATYNEIFKRLGDSNPDFLSAVYDLTDEKCMDFNKSVINSESVYYQSFGSRLNKAVNGKFPLNFSYHIVKYFSGNNDGLVSEDSFSWGNNYKLITVNGNRGVSHGDMIDLNRENIPDFDVREFYVRLLADLKNKGY